MTRADAIERVKKDLLNDLVRDWGAVIATAKEQLVDPATTFDRGLSHDDCVRVVAMMGELLSYIRAWET